MLLTPHPTTVTTHERNILWSMCSLISGQNNTGFLPAQIVEQNGYFPSEMIALNPIRSVDGGYRQVGRILLPVNPSYLGAAIPIWEFCGEIVVL